MSRRNLKNLKGLNFRKILNIKLSSQGEAIKSCAKKNENVLRHPFSTPVWLSSLSPINVLVHDTLKDQALKVSGFVEFWRKMKKKSRSRIAGEGSQLSLTRLIISVATEKN